MNRAKRKHLLECAEALRFRHWARDVLHCDAYTLAWWMDRTQGTLLKDVYARRKPAAFRAVLLGPIREITRET